MGDHPSSCCSCEKVSAADGSQAKTNIVMPKESTAVSAMSVTDLEQEAREQAREQSRARAMAQYRNKTGGGAADVSREATAEHGDANGGGSGEAPVPVTEGKRSKDNEARKRSKDKTLINEELQCGTIDGALLVAAYCGDLHAAQQCLDQGALPTQDITEHCLGYFAVTSGCLPLLKVVCSKDVHKEYSKEWFYLHLGADDATPVMLSLLFGHEEIYTHLLYDWDCPLQLRGSQFTEDDSKSLQHWLSYLPEISNVDMIPRRWPVQFRHNTYDADGWTNEMVHLRKEVSDEDLQEARARRLRTRNFIRACLTSATGLAPRPSPRVAKPASARPGEQHPPSPKGLNHRKALLTAPVGLGLTEELAPGLPNVVTGQLPGKPKLGGWVEAHKQKPHAKGGGPSPLGFEVMANIIPVGASMLQATLGRRGGAGRASTMITGGANKMVNMWACGACQHLHRMDVDAVAVQVLECEGCGKKNLVPEDKAHESSASDSGETDIEEGGGDWWDNEAYEFSSEKVVRECLPMLQRSVLWSMGMHKMRELLRIVKLESMSMGHELFRHGDPVSKLYFLKLGSISFSRNGGEVGSVSIAAGEILPSQFLDLIAVNRGDGHTATATVSSSTASLATFSEKDIVDHCGYSNMHELIGNAIPLAIIRRLKVFRACLTQPEQMALAKSCEYVEYMERDVMVMQGPAVKKLVIVQAGTVKISGGIGKSKDLAEKFLRVGGERPTKQNLKKNDEKWEPTHIFCARSIVFRCQQAVQVLATSESVEAWVLNPERCDPELATIENKIQNGPRTLQRIVTVCLYTQWLSRLPLFSRLNPGDVRLRSLSETLLPKEYWEEEDVVVQGKEDGGDLFIFVEGTALIVKDGVKVSKLTADADYAKVFHFGEEDIVKEKPREATVKVKSPKAWVLQISPADIRREFGSVEALLGEQGYTIDSYLQDLMRGETNRKQERGRSRAMQKRVRSILDIDVPEVCGGQLESVTPTSKTKTKAKTKASPGKAGDVPLSGDGSPKSKSKARNVKEAMKGKARTVMARLSVKAPK